MIVNCKRISSTNCRIVYLTEGFTGGGTKHLLIHINVASKQALMFPSNWCYPHAANTTELKAQWDTSNLELCP